MEEKKITNDENIANLKKRKILRYLIIFFALVTMVLALADLFLQNMLLLGSAIICFLLTSCLNKYRESIKIIKKDELEDVRKEIEATKEKYRKGPKKEDKEKKEENKKETTSKKKSTKKETNSKKKTNKTNK